jgi:hypothetical protein
MGRVYLNAVLSCLKGDFLVEGLDLDDVAEPNWQDMTVDEIVGLEVADAQRNADLTASFYWKVVQPVRKLYA